MNRSLQITTAAAALGFAHLLAAPMPADAQFGNIGAANARRPTPTGAINPTPGKRQAGPGSQRLASSTPLRRVADDFYVDPDPIPDGQGGAGGPGDRGLEADGQGGATSVMTTAIAVIPMTGASASASGRQSWCRIEYWSALQPLVSRRQLRKRTSFPHPTRLSRTLCY